MAKPFECRLKERDAQSGFMQFLLFLRCSARCQLKIAEIEQKKAERQKDGKIKIYKDGSIERRMEGWKDR